jgi:hypothetical protein
MAVAVRVRIRALRREDLFSTRVAASPILKSASNGSYRGGVNLRLMAQVLDNQRQMFGRIVGALKVE